MDKLLNKVMGPNPSLPMQALALRQLWSMLEACPKHFDQLSAVGKLNSLVQYLATLSGSSTESVAQLQWHWDVLSK